jgi:23S rRNA (uridine2552-2'-O)-methyltransferase
MAVKYQRKDKFYQDAKEQGYRSRAAFKLLELNKKFSLFNTRDRVLDLGAWPGSWIQVTQKIVGKSGKIVGIDLSKIDPFVEDNVILLQGDVTNSQLTYELLKVIPEKFNCVISDLAPKLTGIRVRDIAQIEICMNSALNIAKATLLPEGNLVIKVFNCNETDDFFKQCKKDFKSVSKCLLKATRTSSDELYFVGKGWIG